MDALGHCLMMHTKSSNGLANSFNFFKNGEFSPQKCNKSQNIPNMKTKIFSYSSIVLATYGKPNSEMGDEFLTSGNENPEKTFNFKKKNGTRKKRVKDCFLGQNFATWRGK
jgi:hypothetical protein